MSSQHMPVINSPLQHVAFLSKLNSLLIRLMACKQKHPFFCKLSSSTHLLLQCPVSKLSQDHQPLLQTDFFSHARYLIFLSRLEEFTETAPAENVGAEGWGNCVRALQLVRGLETLAPVT